MLRLPERLARATERHWGHGRPPRAAAAPLPPRVAVVVAPRQRSVIPLLRRRPLVVPTASASASAASGFPPAGDDDGQPTTTTVNPTTPTTTTSTSTVAPTVAAVLCAGVLNRVLYRMALVPMAAHTFALAQFQNAAYVAIYGTLVLLRRAGGSLPRSHLSAVPLRRFAVPGACEAAAQLLLMRSAAHLPGAMLPLLAQTTLAWSLFWRAVVLRVAPTRPQAGGVALVAAGVALASLPAAAASASASSSSAAVLTASPANVALCVLSFAFPALATILKEAIFRDAAVALNRQHQQSQQQQVGAFSASASTAAAAAAAAAPSSSSSPSAGRRRKGSSIRSGGRSRRPQDQQRQQLDVLVVNLATSAFQAAFVLALLPLATASRGLALSDLPALLAAGGKQLWAGSPGYLALVPLSYVCVNIAFNVLSLGLVRAVGAVPTALTASAMVPLTVAAFALPLPLLGPSSLGGGFWFGAALTVAGLAVYNGAAEPGALRSWLAARERAAEAATWCAERRSWQQAAALAGAEAEAAAAAAAAAAARLAELKCDDAEVVTAGWGWSAAVAAGRNNGNGNNGSNGTNNNHNDHHQQQQHEQPSHRVVVLPASPLPPSHHLGVLPSSPSPASSSEEQQQQQQEPRRAVPSSP